MKADMLTLHASGGLEMLRAARHAADSLDSPPGLIAVTALTSLDSKDIAALGIGMQIDSYASFLASQAVDSKMDGVVCSPVEAAMLRKELGPRPLLVTPGIRPAIAADDQKRAASPRDAVAAGSDFLVVGRPVTQADDPRAAAQQILDQISG
jgi:orotidine-5'-phosphate decarboxylase